MNIPTVLYNPLFRGVAVSSCALGSSKVGYNTTVKARTGLVDESVERAQALALSNIHRNTESNRLRHWICNHM